MASFVLTPIKKSSCFFEPIFSEFPDILCTPRDFESKTIQACETYFREIAAGTFLSSHNWAPSWRRRVQDKIPADKVACCSRADALVRLRLSLNQLRARIQKGSWYPPIKNGKHTKVALQRFLLEPISTGATSPFLEYYLQALRSPDISIAEIKAELGNTVTEIVEKIATARDRVTDERFWKGAIDLLDWWASLPDEVVYKSPQSQLLLGKASSLFRAVLEFQQQGGMITDVFMGPASYSWGSFKFWLSSKKRVTLE